MRQVFFALMLAVAVAALMSLAGCSALPTDHYIRLSAIDAAGQATVAGGEAGGCQLAWSDALPEGMRVSLVAGRCVAEVGR